MSTRFSLGPRASFWVAAAVMVHTLWTSAAPAMTYPLYAAEWHLTTTVTTAIFSIYPIAVVVVLQLFGSVSDHIGRRKAILLGLAASSLGVLLFAVAPNVAWIFVGRAFMGIGVGLSTGPATAALVEFSDAGQSTRANSVATVATALGLALATLIGGALIQYAPYPMRLNFWVLFAVLAVLFVTAWFLPRHAPSNPAARWQMRGLGIPRGIGRSFAASAISVTAGYSLGAVMLSLGAQIARDLIGSNNAFTNGAAIALLAVTAGIITFLARRLTGNTSILAGGIVSATSMALLVTSATQHSLVTFLAAVATAGAAYSLLFLGGLTLINASAPTHQRAGTLSSIYLIAYLMMGLIAFLLGVAATRWGLEVAIEYGSPVIALLGIAASILVVSNRQFWTSWSPVKRQLQ